MDLLVIHDPKVSVPICIDISSIGELRAKIVPVPTTDQCNICYIYGIVRTTECSAQNDQKCMVWTAGIVAVSWQVYGARTVSGGQR